MVKTITVSRTIKVNLGNYESTDVFVSMTAEVDELDSFAEVFAATRGLVDESALMDVEDIFRTRRKKETRQQLSRRYGIPDRT